MKNILFLIEHIQGGGAERVICELSAAFEINDKVTLAVFEERDTTYRHCHDVINLNIPGTSNPIKKCINLIRRVRAVRKIKKERKIDVSISFISTANIVNVLSGRTHTICSIRTVLSDVRKGKIARKAERFILNRSDKIVTLSKSVEADLVSNLSIKKEKVVTIYNPCMVDKKEFGAESANKDKDVFEIITAGRLVSVKGQWHLIRAFRLFLKSNPESRLVILGEGSLLQTLADLCISLGIESKVEFKGFVSNPEEELMKADLFVLTSLWEGFGNALVEAMACGLPVISTDCSGGPREIIAPDKFGEEPVKKAETAEYGILIPAFPKNDLEIRKNYELTEEENQLYSAMMSIAEQPELRAALSAKAILRSEDFRMPVIVSQWKKCMDEVLAGGIRNI